MKPIYSSFPPNHVGFRVSMHRLVRAIPTVRSPLDFLPAMPNTVAFAGGYQTPVLYRMV